MDRRMALIGLGSALGPILAANWSSRAMAETTSASFHYSSYRRNTLLISSISRQASDIALRRATNAKVKQFAGLERAEQLTLEQVLNGVQNPPLAPVDAGHRADLDKLNNLPAGASFDMAYVSAEIDGHKSLLGLQDDLLRAHPDPSNGQAHIAYFMRTFIFEHLALLTDIQSDYK